MTKKWIVVDLDGTLCDCSHRVHWAQAKQWDKFHAGIMEDKLIEPVAHALDWLSSNYEVALCTGRDSRHFDATMHWLEQNGCNEFVSTLIMRPENDYSPDHELKPRMLFEFFGSKEQALKEVEFILDDRDKVVEAWRNHGFHCWQVAAGSY